jgi:hypothetical protein
MAHKKGEGSVKNGRDSQSKRLGVKIFGGQSAISGKRNEYRVAEYFLQGVTKFISHFLFGSLKKYHSINAKDVAKAMIAQSKKPTQGVQILEYNEMVHLIR